MIDPLIVGEIVSQYEKHGWRLRRALLSNEEHWASMDKSLHDVAVEASSFDALWFSRRSQPDTEAWELRRLTGSPFALVAVVPADAGAEELDATLSQVVEEMRSKTMA